MTLRYAFFGLAVFLCACSFEPDAAKNLNELKKRGVLKVASRDFATSVYHHRDGSLQGLEYDLIQSFASHMGLKVELVMKDGVAGVLTELEAQQVDIGAAALTQTSGRKERFIAPRFYETVEEWVVCQSKINIDRVGELAATDLVVEKESSYEERLKELKKELKALSWKSVENSSEEILQQIDDEKAECTLIDSNLFKIFRRYYPSVKKQFSLKGETPIGWLLPTSRKFLKPAVNSWIDRITVSGELKRLLDKHYGFSDRFDPYDLKKFRERISTRLPEYQDLFKEASKKHGFDWQFLAALSYQESHWDPMATSPTGVQGLMMLTQKTAKSLGVVDRKDPRQSIMGGAQYLRSRMQRLPRFIPEAEKVWFALAAYNIGYGHLTDARALTVQMHLNPNRWIDVRTALPRLSNPRWNRLTKFGYARGIEPVLYVKRIRDYYDILRRELNP